MLQARHVRILYMGTNRASTEAEEILKKAHLEFQSLRIRNPRQHDIIVPQLLTTEGFFETLNDIRWYANLYGRKKINSVSHRP